MSLKEDDLEFELCITDILQRQKLQSAISDLKSKYAHTTEEKDATLQFTNIREEESKNNELHSKCLHAESLDPQEETFVTTSMLRSDQVTAHSYNNLKRKSEASPILG